ncbi:MAG TPA: response regulator [Actinomycetota bacterium]|nr:response regulator [Actinomycetota bacterium]
MESRPRVLIVEDDPMLRVVLRHVLEEYCDVAEAATGAAALPMAWDHRPDVIVLDRHMPAMSGNEAAPYLRVLAPNATIVAFSAELRIRPPWADAYVDKGDLQGLIDVARARTLVLS